MIRRVFIGLVLMLVPVAPAAAVVAIAMPVVQPANAAIAKSAVSAASGTRQASSGLAFGEIVAALAGIAVIGLVRAAGRQPHSVAA